MADPQPRPIELPVMPLEMLVERGPGELWLDKLGDRELQLHLPPQPRAPIVRLFYSFLQDRAWIPSAQQPPEFFFDGLFGLYRSSRMP